MLCGCHRIADCSASKIGSTVAILDDCLAINDCCLAWEVGGGANDGLITLAPIKPISVKDPRSTTLHDYNAAVAIMFDFMTPVIALWGLIDQGRKLRLDEPESGMEYAKHGLGRLIRRSPDGFARASSALEERR